MAPIRGYSEDHVRTVPARHYVMKLDCHCCYSLFAESQLAFFKLHGNMSQQERTAVFKNFSQAKNGILLCTVSAPLLSTNMFVTKVFIRRLKEIRT